MDNFDQIVTAAAGKSAPEDIETPPTHTRKSVRRKKAKESLEPPKIKMEDFLREKAAKNQEIIDETGKVEVAEGYSMEDFLRKKAAKNQEIIDKTGKYKVVKGRDWEAEKDPAVKKSEDIQKIARDIFEKRKNLNPDSQDIAPTQDDLHAAKVVYETMQRPEATNAALKKPLEENVRESESSPASPETTLEDLKADLDAKADSYATARGNARGSRGYLAKLLGISKNVEESEEVKAARLEYLQAKKAHSDTAVKMAFKEYQDKLQSGTASPEELDILKAQWESIGNYHNRTSDIELQGKFVDKTVEYYKTKGGILGKVFGKYLDFYQNVYLKKVPAKVRAVISIAMMGGAVAGVAGAFGVAGGFAAGAALVSKPVRFLLAPLMPAMTYAGTGKMMEKGLQLISARKGKKRSVAYGAVIEKMKTGEASPEHTKEILMALLEEQNNEYGEDLVKRGWREDRCQQALNYLTMFVGARAAWVVMSGTEAISSFFENKGNLSGVVQDSSETPLYAQGADGRTRITQKGLESIGDTPAESVKLPPEQLEQIQKLAADADAAAKARIMDELKSSLAPEPEAKMSDLRSPDASSKIAELGVQEIAPVKIGQGGTMWGSIENNIRSNPSAYKLNPEDPNFTKEVRRKTAEMLHDFADKRGLSYKQLDKVFAGDSFSIKHDTATGKFYLDDFRGKAFGADVSHAGAAQEIAPSKGGMPVEHTRPRTGAGLAEHQPTRGGGKMKFSPEIEEMDRAAQENTVKARGYYEAVQDYKTKVGPQIEQMSEMAHVQQVRATGSLLKRVFEGAGVSEYADILNKPMNEWENLIGKENYIAQDVQLTDETRVASFNKLKNLRMILERYKIYGSESIGECLFKAMKDSKNVYMINKLVLTK